MKPLHDRVLVRIDPATTQDTTTPGGLVVLSGDYGTTAFNPLKRAMVLAVGDGEILYDGKLRPLAIKPGDTILVHENELLVTEPILDPLSPYEALISERQILAVL